MSREATEEQTGTSDEPSAEEPVSSRSTRPQSARYGAAVAAVGLALLIQWLLLPLFGVDPDTSPFVMVAAWFGGFRYSEVLGLLPGGEEQPLRAGVGWKEGPRHRS